MSDPIQIVSDLAADVPGEIERINRFLFRLSEGFEAFAIITESIQAQHTERGDVAMMGMMGQRDEIDGLRKAVLDSTRRADIAERTIKEMLFILSSPISHSVGGKIVEDPSAKARFTMAVAARAGFAAPQSPHKAPETQSGASDDPKASESA